MRRVDFIVGARDFKTLVAEQFMQDAVYCFQPEVDGEVLAQTLTDEGFGSVPIVDQNRRLLGIVSEFDLLHAVKEEKHLASIKAEDLMTPNRVCDKFMGKVEEGGGACYSEYIDIFRLEVLHARRSQASRSREDPLVCRVVQDWRPASRVYCGQSSPMWEAKLCVRSAGSSWPWAPVSVDDQAPGPQSGKEPPPWSGVAEDRTGGREPPAIP